MYRVAAILVMLASSAALGAERTVWQIGKPDHDYSEFAFAGNYQAYAAKFGGKPVVFEVGRSDPARDWPFIQPGPVDVWSPAGGKPWTIRFTLPEEPRGIFKLCVEFADVQKQSPPRFVVAIGDRTGAFQLAAGGGDESLTNPRAGKPQKIALTLPAAFFHQGANEIRLACAEGSWVQYDAITLTGDSEGKLPPADVQSITARPTPFFLRRDGQLRRAVDVSVGLTAPASDVLLRAEAAGQTIEVPVKQLAAFGSITEEVSVPDSAGPLDVKLTATVEGRSKTATVRVPPQRKWRVYVAPSSHTDIGYTDVQPKCAERHCQNIDTAIDLIKQFPDFRWNTEVAWQAENYVHSRSGQRLADFYRYAREGKIGIQALFCNELTGLCSAEEACRLTWFAHKLSRQQGIPYLSAMISDVPTQEASLPMILANAGIRYFSSGINNDRAYNFTQMQNKCPCWWAGPDGSRVLMMYTWQYAQASQWALTESFEQSRARVLANLQQYEARADYPYDAVFLHGAVSDNQPLNAKLAEVAKQWNDRYEYPKIILSHNAEFFKYVEKKYGDKLAVYRGSAGTYWEDGAGSSARETAMNRRAHERLANGEKLLALADRIGGTHNYNAEEIYQAWRNCILYDEHTWGAYCSISEPDTAFTKAQWKIKAQFAVDADKQARAILDKGAGGLASLVQSDGPALVVFNPLSWPRTDVVQTRLPEGMGLADANVRFETTPEGVLLLVKDVPACGYRVLKLVPRAKKEARADLAPASTPDLATAPVPKLAPAATPDLALAPIPELAAAAWPLGNVIESRFYRVQFDPQTGGIVSIRDKELGQELVDPKAPFQLNQYVYVAGGNNGTRIVMNPNAPAPQLTLTGSGKASLNRRRRPGMGDSMLVTSSGPMVAKIESLVIVWDDIKRIDIANRFSKEQTYAKEAVYFAFPFAARQPTFRYEAPAAIVNANRDMLPGACLDWFTVQHFVEVEGRDATIAWATPDAPLACFQDINRGKWQTQLPLTTGHIYAYLMNNYWHTNYLAGQGGDYSFRFSITSRPKSDNVASARFGWAASNPLLGIVVKANPQGPLPEQPTSLISVDEPGVIVTGVKEADEGHGLVVRLWEITGQATTAHLRLDTHIPAAKATACNLVEEPGNPLEIQGGVISVPIRGSGLATVRIDTAGEGK
jgi:hypothetical protein